MEGTLSTERGVRAALVGRQRELAELNAALERAIQYQTPQTVTVVGNQGVGKTRLIDHWLGLIEEKHVRVIRCLAKPNGSAYSLFTGLLEDRFGLREAADPAEVFRRQVEEVLQDKRITEVLHFLGGFVGIAVRENPFLRALEDALPQQDQIARTVLRRFLETDAQRSPLLLVLEDLQHADDDSISLFQELSESLEGAPILMLASCRPELLIQQAGISSLEGENHKIDLPYLSSAEAEELLRRLLARVQEVPAGLVDLAVEMTGGNPFFIEELVRVLLANGTIRVEGEIWSIDEQRFKEIELPMSVEEAVQARVATLTSIQRDVLEKAATLGSVFWLEALVCLSRLQQEIEEKSHIWMADVLQQTIQEVLQELVEKDYLLRMPDSSIPDATEYIFKHNLEREQIVRMVGPDRMRNYHLFAAQWLETKIPDRSEAQLEFLAEHYERGGNKRRAGFCFVRAGDKARARYANDQAITYYRHGIDLMDLSDVLAKIEALHNLGDVCAIMGRTEEALESFSEMLRFAWLLDHSAKGGAAHRRIGRIYSTLGEHERALRHLDMALHLFERASDSRGAAATLDDVGHLAQLKGEYDKALEIHGQALAIKKEINDPRAIAVTLNNIGAVQQSSGSFNAARDCFIEALELRKEVGDRMGVVDSLYHLGGVYRAQSDYTKAFELWIDALRLSQEIGDRLQEAHLFISLGEAEIQLGKLKDAEGHLSEAAALAKDLGDKQLLASCCRAFCEVKLAIGDLVGAEQEAKTALALGEKLGLKPEMAAALQVMAEVVAAHDIDEDGKKRAIELYGKAITLFTELGNDLGLARTFASFADFHDRCGHWQNADLFRSRADEIFNRLKGLGPSPSPLTGKL